MNRKSKGQFSFLTKGFLLVFLIIAMSLVINQITFYQINNEKIQKEYDLSSTAMNIINLLSNSDRCLALNENVTIGGMQSTKTYTRILDIEKIENFTRDYSETEPECAKNYLIGYNVTIELIPIDIHYEFTPEEEITVLQKMLEELEGRSTVFVIDLSKSMEELVGRIRKDDCVKRFLNEFIDNLDSSERLSVVGYGTTGQVDNEDCSGGREEPSACDAGGPLCGAETLIASSVIGGNQETMKNQVNAAITAEGCTPMAHGLVRGYEIAENNGIDDIVVLTDGCENCAGNSVCVVQNHASSGIRVHTIAFGQRTCRPEDREQNCVCSDTLSQISSLTGGLDFIARECRELIRDPNVADASVEKAEWRFGTTGHSHDQALTASVTLSLPIVVKQDDELLAGFIRLSAYDGDLEAVSGLIEYVCRKGTQADLEMFADLPMRFYNNEKKLCITRSDGSDECRKVDCDVDIEMDDILNKGRYKILAFREDERVRVVV